MEEKIEKYIELLLNWNNKINLIGKSTIEDIHNRHILDSKQVLDYLTKEELDKLTFADFGSGAGIPGIILSIYGVKKIYLLEKSFRKCEFLQEAKKISNNEIIVENKNIYEINNLKFDIIISRALASLDKLLEMILPFMKENSKCIFLKGKKTDEELVEAKKRFKFDCEIYNSKTSSEGKILIIRKVIKV